MTVVPARVGEGLARLRVVRISDQDATKRLLPSTSLGWIISHLAGRERRRCLIWAQGITDLAPTLNEWRCIAKPANTPVQGLGILGDSSDRGRS
jgi:hypothetical protein